MPVLGYVLIAILAIWLLLTIVNQIFLLAGFAKVRVYPNLDWDPMAVIPRWIFWSAPPPREWQLLYRDKLPDGSLTPWKTAWRMRRNRFRWIWNPEIRRWKAVADCCYTLITLASKGGGQRNELFVSWAYVATANYVSGIKPAPDRGFRQFMIANVCGFDNDDPARILFLSPLFELGTRS